MFSRGKMILDLIISEDKYLLDLPKYESTKGTTTSEQLKAIENYKFEQHLTFNIPEKDKLEENETNLGWAFFKYKYLFHLMQYFLHSFRSNTNSAEENIYDFYDTENVYESSGTEYVPESSDNESDPNEMLLQCSTPEKSDTPTIESKNNDASRRY